MYDGGYLQRSRHSIRINGSFWGVVLANNASYLAEFLQADIASLLELPRSTIYIADMRIGSLICEFIATRNASQIIPDNLINAKLLGARLPDTFALYFDTTGSREDISTTASAVVKSSTDPAGTKSACDSSCVLIVGTACGAFGLLCVIGIIAVVRWRRSRRNRAKSLARDAAAASMSWRRANPPTSGDAPWYRTSAPPEGHDQVQPASAVANIDFVTFSAGKHYNNSSWLPDTSPPESPRSSTAAASDENVPQYKTMDSPASSSGIRDDKKEVASAATKRLQRSKEHDSDFDASDDGNIPAAVFFADFTEPFESSSSDEVADGRRKSLEKGKVVGPLVADEQLEDDNSPFGKSSAAFAMERALQRFQKKKYRDGGNGVTVVPEPLNVRSNSPFSYSPTAGGTQGPVQGQRPAFPPIKGSASTTTIGKIIAAAAVAPAIGKTKGAAASAALIRQQRTHVPLPRLDSAQHPPAAAAAVAAPLILAAAPVAKGSNTSKTEQGLPPKRSSDTSTFASVQPPSSSRVPFGGFSLSPAQPPRPDVEKRQHWSSTVAPPFLQQPRRRQFDAEVNSFCSFEGEDVSRADSIQHVVIDMDSVMLQSAPAADDFDDVPPAAAAGVMNAPFGHYSTVMRSTNMSNTDRPGRVAVLSDRIQVVAQQPADRHDDDDEYSSDWEDAGEEDEEDEEGEEEEEEEEEEASLLGDPIEEVFEVPMGVQFYDSSSPIGDNIV